MSTTINRFLDELPRPRLFRGCAERPAFRSLGVMGYHAALVATLGAGLIAGRSLLVLAAVSAVCAASFFAWAYVRRAISGREVLVLLEHVWIAALAAAGALHLMGEPILPYLDAVSVGLAVFLAFGRAGCLLVGCCHGHPSSIGVRYGDACVRDGFPAHLAGVRLFPVQAIELAGLVGIAACGVFLVGSPEPGRALIWFLASYSVLRFGLEGLRGDERPHLLGLSQARWMAIGELGVALALGERWRSPPRIGALFILAATLVVALAVARRFEWRRRFLAPTHLAELRGLVRACLAELEKAGGVPAPIPAVRRTSLHASTSVSLLPGAGAAHVSLALPLPDVDLRLLCDAMAGALPEIEPHTGRVQPASLLHVTVPLPLPETPARGGAAPARRLYGAVLSRMQAEPDGEPPARAAPAPAAREVAVQAPSSPEVRLAEPPAAAPALPEVRLAEPPARPPRADRAGSRWDERLVSSVEPWRRVNGSKPAVPPDGPT